MQEIQSSIELEHTVSEASWKDMFMAPVLRVTMLGMAVQFFQQITGTNSILYYTVSCLIRHVSEEANLDSHLYLNAVASGILKQPTSPLGV
jgi:hypothetical protein